jgi:hypothetical protein
MEDLGNSGKSGSYLHAKAEVELHSLLHHRSIPVSRQAGLAAVLLYYDLLRLRQLDQPLFSLVHRQKLLSAHGARLYLLVVFQNESLLRLSRSYWAETRRW